MILLAFLFVWATLPGLFGQAGVKASSCFENTEIDGAGQLWNLISTPQELDCVRQDLSGNFKLTNNISKEDMESFLMDSSTHTIRSWEPIEGADDEPFTGRFDGNGHSIEGLTTQIPDMEYVGLFARLKNANISNLKIVNANIVGNESVGVLAGRSDNSMIDKVHVTGLVSGYYRSGGLVGYSTGSLISGSSATVDVSSLESANGTFGGLIARSKNDIIVGNWAYGNVLVQENADSAGGLIGKAENSSIARNYALGNVEGNYEVGGLIGELEYEKPMSIVNNYAVGKVISKGNGTNGDFSAEKIGGLFGALDLNFDEPNEILEIHSNYYGGSLEIIDDSTDGLSIDSGSVGAFLGEKGITNDHVEFLNNYFVSVNDPAFELDQSNYATGKTPAEMQLMDTFKEWDFNIIWDFQLGVNNDFPVLRPYPGNQTPAPAFEPGYPMLSTVTPSMTKIVVKLNKAGRVYFDNQPLDELSDQTSETTKLNAISQQAYVDVQANEEKAYLIKDLSPGTDYSIFITAEDTQSKLVDYPEKRNYKTHKASPIIPHNVIATADDGQAMLTWTFEQGAIYELYLYEGSEAPEDPEDWVVVGNYQNQLVTGLTNGISYVFAVKAYYIEDGSVSEFIPSNVVTPQAAGTPVLPDAPETIVAQAGDGKATVYWAGVINVNQFVLYKYQGTQAPQDKHDWIKVKSGIEAESYTVDDLTNGLPYVFAIRSSNENGLSDYKVSGPVTPKGSGNEGGGTPTPGPTPNPTPTPSPSTSVPSVTPAPQKEVIKVNVENGDQAATVASLEISRTRGTDGTVKDELQLSQSKAQSIIDQLKQTGSSTAVILIPDVKDEVTQWDLTLSSGSSALLAEQGVNLVISNPNVRITIPANSLKDRTDDIYFRLVPVKKEAERADIQTRAQSNESIIQFAGTKDIQILGRPMTIETNLQSRPVTLVLPIIANQLAGVNSEELGVYIEHSDGTKELVHGKLVTLNSDNQQGVEIEVDHFSTFSIVKVKDWTDNTLKAQPYIQGYADDSFRPERSVTRAEMATLITRVLGTSTTEGNHTFKDVKPTHWAELAIAAAAQSGYVKGYTDGSFKPDQAMTRAELASVLQHLLNTEQTADEANTFNDVNDHWAQQAIARLNAAGVVTGYEDGTFRPSQPVTRAEAVTMLNKLIGLDPATNAVRQWSDVSNTHWAYKAIEAASISQ
ncbi:S-layer homology domain-containing protein [Paenibacillus xylanexedens]|uniref:S-layer homology domain-containing protein n=1 Tax=Paenibacillus xylanexedens TaxID=528191 RepID=UPI0016436933|nr:S-layer homology domain-containing protein [Paenibacillus xylanexedens]